jgi:glutathione S-transferase
VSERAWKNARVVELYTRNETAATIVHCVLEWAGAPHRVIEVRRDDDGGVSPPGYLGLNPRGTVPTLVDGEMVLYETVAILEYLVESFPGLGPRAGEPGRPELHFWLAWLTNNLMAAFYRWFKADEMIAGDAVEALKSGATSNLTELGAWLERQVTSRVWLVGESPSVADLFLQGLGSWAAEIDGLEFGGESLSDHAARTLALPGVMAALDQERVLGQSPV